MTNQKTNLLGLDAKQMQELFAGISEPSYRANQMLRWLHQTGISDFEQCSNFSKKLRQHLNDNFCIELPTILNTQLSADGTCKWLLGLNENNSIEMVFIPEEKRGTLCISSQIGCALDCSFCATGKQGFNRNLKAWEIIAQVWIATQSLLKEESNQRITNIVFMGMGEPLLNIQQVGIAARLLLDDNAYGLSKRRVTVSTAGVVPMILRLNEEADVSLAISLHAPNDNLRNELVPINKKYPIKDLLAACKTSLKGCDQRKHILFEYVLLDGVNDQPEHAHQLGKIVRDIPCKVNLIPFNPFFGSGYKTSPVHVQLRFQNILRSHKVRSLLRRTRGSDIEAACGQLAGKVKDRTRRTISWKKSIENQAIVASKA